MKKLTLLLIGLIMAAGAAQAQAPRVRTSAPAEQTAKKDAKARKNPGAAKSGGMEATTPKARKSGGAEATMPTYMAVKSNIAYDAVAVLNLAYEVQIARHFSLEIPVMWSLWDWQTDRGLRTVALQPGVKYWFGEVGRKNALGVDFDLAWYNGRHDERRYQSADRPLMGASLVYSYTLNMGRGWKAEFALGVGYVNTQYNTYYNITNGALIDTRTRNYVGPTRIGITLAYQL